MSELLMRMHREHLEIRRRLWGRPARAPAPVIEEEEEALELSPPWPAPEPDPEYDVETVLANLPPPAIGRRRIIKAIGIYVALREGLKPPHAVFLKSRASRIVDVRRVYFEIARRLFPMSLPQFGRSVGYDHTTILHHRDALRKRMAADPEVARRVDELTAEVRQRLGMAEGAPR